MDDFLRDVQRISRSFSAASRENDTSTDVTFWVSPETALNSGHEHFQNGQYLDDVGLKEIREFHDFIVSGIQELERKQGGRAITEVPVTSLNGITARADLLVWKVEEAHPFFCEVKTGMNPVLSPNQRYVYPLIGIGAHVYSRDFRISQFGFSPGALLPPLGVLGIYVLAPGVEPVNKWIVHRGLPI